MLIVRWWRSARLPTALACLAALPCSSYGQIGAAPDRLTVALPEASWVLEVRTPGFTVHKDEVAPDRGGRYVYAVGSDPDVALSVRLERTAGTRTPEECRRHAWDHLRARSPFRMDEVALSETAELALLEYRVREFRGFRVEQLHLHGYLAKDDVCVEIHVSKVRATAADRAGLAAVIKSARITPRVF